MADLLIKNVGELATPRGKGPLCGAAQGEFELVRGAAVAVKDGLISYAGPERDAPAAAAVLDAGGCLVTPGLVDAHTHLVFGGWRQNELALGLQGVPYLEILRAGGGILSTVRSTRLAAEEELYGKAEKILREMLAHGVTLCEAKSGYGLEPETEYRQLEVIKRLGEAGPVELVPTFMGAHALPEEYKDNREGFLRLVCETMLPAVAGRRLARFCDVFCEEGVFSAAESERILSAAKEHGLGLKIHADEIARIGGSQLAAKLGAVSAEHLIASDSASVAAMAGSGVIAVLLPATSFYLDKPYAPAREMLRQGMAVAAASDFNPGSSPGCNLQLVMNLACLKYRLTPREALAAVTLNAAAAVGMAERAGSLEPGKQADILLWDAPDLDYIFYRFGSNLVSRVYKKGCPINTGKG